MKRSHVTWVHQAGRTYRGCYTVHATNAVCSRHARRNIATLAKRLLRQPKLIECEPTQANHDNIEQRLHYVDDGGHKHRILDHVLRGVDLTQGDCFHGDQARRTVLAEKLNDGGHTAAALHGNMNQSQRNRTLARLRSGNVRCARCDGRGRPRHRCRQHYACHNYDLPKVAEDYVHRIVRTRACRSSRYRDFVRTPDEGQQLKQSSATRQSDRAPCDRRHGAEAKAAQ
jgi:superfamily II DNA/RNA helicase